MRRLFTDTSFLFLLIANAYCLLYYLFSGEDYGVVMWMYWLQSMTIGFFNFLDILTLREPKMSTETGTPKSGGNGCAATFFLVHYGGFHLAYLGYLLVTQREGLTHFNALLLAIAGFFIEGTIQFRHNKIYQQSDSVNVAFLFFMPYVRIVPMHLMILGPAFLGWQPTTIFLVLKTIADILFYFIYRNIYRK